MRIATRFAIAMSITFVLMGSTTALFRFIGIDYHSERALAVDIERNLQLGATDLITGNVTLDALDPGKPPLSIGTPVDDVVIAASQQSAHDDLDVPSFATVEQQQLAATENGGKPLLLHGATVQNVIVAAKQPESGSVRAALHAQVATTGDPVNLWYGSAQPFGQNGEPQTQINLLGTIMTPTSNISVTYVLNDGLPRPLHVGPDTRRLALPGDFNVDIAYTDLVTGINSIVITATDENTFTTSETVLVNYAPGNQWPLPYTTNWATAGSIQDRSQVVDGEWALNNGTIRPLVLDYDRLVAIGDTEWTDYEVTVPLTIHAIDDGGFSFPSNGPGVGLILQWQGHFQQAMEQPATGWQNFGAIGWYRWGKENTGATTAAQQMLAYQGREIAVNPAKTPDFGVPYMMKMSVQSIANKPAYYRFKTWRASEPEPVLWDMEASGRSGEPVSGSFLLVAHHVDVTFGDVMVRPLSSITPVLSTDTDGNGAILITPSKDQYAYGEVVKLTPTGNSGYAFNQWSGDVEGTENPLTLFVTQDMSITAAFVEPESAMITTTTTGKGAVQISPQKTNYEFDELVAITAIPEPGFQFTGWNGAATGLNNPLIFHIRQDTNLTAAFGTAAPPTSDDFNSCELNEALWTIRDPKGDSTISINGQQLLITVPANVDHDLFENKNFAPRLLQDVTNENFIIEVKFDSRLDSRFQMQGIIVEQDTDNFLRLEYYHDGTEVRIFAALFQDGNATIKANQIITVPSDGDLYMRLTRNGNTWTQERSFDGLTWSVNATFDHTLTAAQAGVYAGNVDPIANDGEDTSPAHTAIIDYFFNTASPIVPEDGNPLTLSTTVVGNGTITKNPDQAAYACDESIQLTATPDDNWTFDSWSGAVTGTTNPITMTLAQGNSATATFVQEQTMIYLPIIAR